MSGRRLRFILLFILNYASISKGNYSRLLREECEQDPYKKETDGYCYAGDVSQCFKSTALTTFAGLFEKEEYPMAENVRLVRMPEDHYSKLKGEPFKMAESPRSGDGEWDRLVKFAERRLERFLQTTAMEITVRPEDTDNGTYAPRFIDEIYSELDTIEDKNGKPNKRYEIKKLFIPLLVMLKIFKLKLLLFLPFILGLASFKKVLGFLIILIPGIIGYFKICKPDLGHSYGSYGHSSFYHRPPHRNHVEYDNKRNGQAALYGPDPHTIAYRGYLNENSQDGYGHV